MTVNPWYEVLKEAESAQVVVTDIPSSVKIDPNHKLISEQKPPLTFGYGVSIEIDINNFV